MSQLTSLQSLQKSLDILRSHRPAYTPRTGFVWPIVEPPSGDASAAKKRVQDGDAAAEPQTQEPEDLPGARGLSAASSDAKRQQNNMLFLNAMRTTAVHARESFQLPTLAPEEIVPETPAATVTRSSATPAPGPGGLATRASSIAPTPQEATKGPPGGGKKKKKRKFDTARWVIGTQLSSRLRDGNPSIRASIVTQRMMPSRRLLCLRHVCTSHQCTHEGYHFQRPCEVVGHHRRCHSVHYVHISLQGDTLAGRTSVASR